MFHPNQLDPNWYTFFIHKIICSSNNYKIFHGSDSLDIPYLYFDLLNNNTKLIKKFNKKFIDTKYLCEFDYFRQNLNLGKCKIYSILNYNSLLKMKL